MYRSVRSEKKLKKRLNNTTMINNNGPYRRRISPHRSFGTCAGAEPANPVVLVTMCRSTPKRSEKRRSYPPKTIETRESKCTFSLEILDCLLCRLGDLHAGQAHVAELEGPGGFGRCGVSTPPKASRSDVVHGNWVEWLGCARALQGMRVSRAAGDATHARE